MTACAMTVGMVPMALALERGSQMQAPLGRAVIGGLVMSTFATLLVVPSIFALVIGRKVSESPSIYPYDVESPHYDPDAAALEEKSGKSGQEGPDEHGSPAGPPEEQGHQPGHGAAPEESFPAPHEPHGLPGDT